MEFLALLDCFVTLLERQKIDPEDLKKQFLKYFFS